MVYKPPHLPDEAAAVCAILKQKAREIAAGSPLPDFYRAHADDIACARGYLNHDPLLMELRVFVAERLEDDFGHGMKHALKVAADAGALSLIEGRRAGYAETRIQRISIVSQAAGLLHDIHRKQKDHAVEGARYARDPAQKADYRTCGNNNPKDVIPNFDILDFCGILDKCFINHPTRSDLIGTNAAALHMKPRASYHQCRGTIDKTLIDYLNQRVV